MSSAIAMFLSELVLRIVDLRVSYRSPHQSVFIRECGRAVSAPKVQMRRIQRVVSKGCRGWREVRSRVYGRANPEAKLIHPALYSPIIGGEPLPAPDSKCFTVVEQTYFRRKRRHREVDAFCVHVDS